MEKMITLIVDNYPQASFRMQVGGNREIDELVYSPCGKAAGIYSKHSMER